MNELTYKYRLYPTAAQQQKITQINNTVQLLYNRMLKGRTEHYRKTGKWRRLDAAATAKSSRLFDDLDPSVISCTQKSLEGAYRHFFWMERTQKDRYRKESLVLAEKDPTYKLKDTDLVGYPRFKEQGLSENWTVSGDKVSFAGKRVDIPGVGAVKIVRHRPLPEGSVLKACTVIRKPSGHYYLLCRIEIKEIEQKKRLENAVGVTLEPGRLAVRSNDVPVEFGRQQDDLTRRIERAHKTLRRRTPGSAGYEEQRIHLSRLIEKRVNQRWDALHKISREIVDTADAVYVERPDIIRRKKKLAKAGELDKILNEAWWKFTSFLEYKADLAGKKFWRVARVFPAYRICSACGAYGDDRSKEGIFACPKCGQTIDRAANAAKVYETLGRKYIKEWNALNEQQ